MGVKSTQWPFPVSLRDTLGHSSAGTGSASLCMPFASTFPIARLARVVGADRRRHVTQHGDQRPEMSAAPGDHALDRDLLAERRKHVRGEWRA